MIRERLGNLLKTREVKQEEQLKKIDAAFQQEEIVNALYRKGELSLEQYNEALDVTRPITRIYWGELAAELRR